RDRNGRGVGADDRVALEAGAERGEDLTFDLFFLRGRFDHQIAIAEIVERLRRADALERGVALLVGNALASDLAGKIAADGGEPFGNTLDIDIVEQHVQAGERADMRDPIAHLTRTDHADLADGMSAGAMIAARLRPLLHFDHLRLPFARCLLSPVNDRAFPTDFQALGPVPARPGRGLPPTHSRRLGRWALPRPC